MRPEVVDAGPRIGFRADIEGLRAIAILTVLGYHAGLPFLPGGFIGVDVFFVISGFLITGLLVTELASTSALSIPRFYARRIKRLLPSIGVVLVVVVAMSFLVLSPFRRTIVGGDVIASGLFAANWHFGAQSVDYLGAQEATSPVLHFWSLAVEEQFYVVWPFVLILFTRLKRRSGSDLTRPLLVGLVAVFVPSLLWSLHQTVNAAGWAYFSSFTRAWELALGGGMAILVPMMRRMALRPAIVLGWVGLLAICWAAVVLTADTPYPGTAALVPTLGTAALLAAGAAMSSRATGRWDFSASSALSISPLRHVGRISYAWYLWHWPLLVFAAAWLGHGLSVLQGVVIVAFSYLPTIVMHRYVELPFRHSKTLVEWPKRAFALAGVIVGIIVAGGLWLQASEPIIPVPAAGTVLGAETLPTPVSPSSNATGAVRSPVGPPSDSPTLQTRVTSLTPSLADARGDLPSTYADGCHRSFASTSADGCVFGKPNGAVTVVLFGDSHAAQWFPALKTLADQRGWRLVSLTKSGCPASDITPNNSTIKRDYTECPAWRANALARISKEHPDVVVTTGITGYSQTINGQRTNGAAAEEQLREGWVRTLHELVPLSNHVVVLRDTPEPARDPVDCVSANLDNLDRCAAPRGRALPPNLPLDLAARTVAGVDYIDLSDAFCLTNVCPVVIGDVLVYRDHDHITATYARTLAPRLLSVMPSLR